jgi:hypothetical protein
MISQIHDNQPINNFYKENTNRLVGLKHFFAIFTYKVNTILEG